MLLLSLNMCCYTTFLISMSALIGLFLLSRVEMGIEVNAVKPRLVRAQERQIGCGLVEEVVDDRIEDVVTRVTRCFKWGDLIW